MKNDEKIIKVAYSAEFEPNMLDFVIISFI